MASTGSCTSGWSGGTRGESTGGDSPSCTPGASAARSKNQRRAAPHWRRFQSFGDFSSRARVRNWRAVASETGTCSRLHQPRYQRMVIRRDSRSRSSGTLSSASIHCGNHTRSLVCFSNSSFSDISSAFHPEPSPAKPRIQPNLGSSLKNFTIRVEKFGHLRSAPILTFRGGCLSPNNICRSRCRTPPPRAAACPATPIQ